MSSTANSSPPSRATVSAAGGASSRGPTSTSSRSPAWWPEGVVDLLEPVEVQHEHGGTAGTGQGRLGPRVEGGPVRQAGERVVNGQAFDGQAVRPVGPPDHPEDHQTQDERQERAELKQRGVAPGAFEAGDVPPDLALLLAAQQGEEPVRRGLDVPVQNAVGGRRVAGVEKRQIPPHGGPHGFLQSHHVPVAPRLGGVAGGEPPNRGGGADLDGVDGPALGTVRFPQQRLQRSGLAAGQVRRLLVAVGAVALGRDGAHDRRLAQLPRTAASDSAISVAASAPVSHRRSRRPDVTCPDRIMLGVHLGSRADVAAEQRVSLLFGPDRPRLSPVAPPRLELWLPLYPFRRASCQPQLQDRGVSPERCPGPAGSAAPTRAV